MGLVIRHAEKQDVAEIKAIYEQPHVIAGTLQLPFPSVGMWEQRLEKLGEGNYNLVATIDDRVVGQLLLTACSNPRKRHVATFGMAVCATELRKGVGRGLLQAALDMCDNWLNVTRVELQVFSDNEAAIRLYEQMGFLKEGEHPDYANKGGMLVSAITMARIKDTRLV